MQQGQRTPHPFSEPRGANRLQCLRVRGHDRIQSLRRVLAQIGKRAARIVGWSQAPIERGRQGHV